MSEHFETPQMGGQVSMPQGSEHFRTVDMSDFRLPGERESRFSYADVPAAHGIPFAIIHLKDEHNATDSLRIDLNKLVFLGDVPDKSLRDAAPAVAERIITGADSPMSAQIFGAKAVDAGDSRRAIAGGSGKRRRLSRWRHIEDESYRSGGPLAPPRREMPPPILAVSSEIAVAITVRVPFAAAGRRLHWSQVELGSLRQCLGGLLLIRRHRRQVKSDPTECLTVSVWFLACRLGPVSFTR